MEDEKDGIKVGKVMKKSLKALAIPILIIIIIIIMMLGSIYYIFKKDLKDLTKKQVEYNKSLKMTSDGIQNINEVEEGEGAEDNNAQSATDKAKEIASEIDCLERYVKDSPDMTKEEKIAYLMNAEVVTKFPYLESIKDDKEKLNGTIRFYRHESNEEEGAEGTQLEYIEPDIFEEYKNSGNKDIFKYFTIDEDQNIVIAYGSSETRTVTTNDSEVTADVVNKNSSFDVSYGGSGGNYSATKYTINEKPIDYKPLIEQYVLPFNLLATMLVQTRDYNLVKEIADLAYNSEVRIGIYINETETNNVDTYTYNKEIKYTENTELIFDNIGGSNPEIDINSGVYSDVGKACYGFINNVNGTATATHSSNRNDSLGTSSTHGTAYSAFVSSMEGGNITGVTENESEAQTFKTTYTRHTISNSTTTGVELANIWAGIWKATYKKEEKTNGSTSNGGDPYDEQYVSMSRNEFSTEVINSGVIGDKLTEHSEELKKAAIYQIVSKTKFETSSREMTVQDIFDCASQCSQCVKILNQVFPEPNVSWHRYHVHYVGDQDLLNAVKGATSSSNGLYHVRYHVNQMIQNQANAQNVRKIENFENHLKNKITYDQWPTAYKAKVSISSETSGTTKTTTYKKDSIEKPEDAGKEFKKILSKDKYEEDREALMVRSEWFWEAIQENEDTEKLENLLRYLFNIAFDTDQFGEFSEEDIENLFKAFEPQELKNATFNGAISIGQYLAQYGGDYTIYTFDDVDYYRIHNDSAGNPTVGAGDIQWKSNHSRFSSTFELSNGTELGTGTVRYGGEGGTTYANINVEEKVNELLGGSDTVWSKSYEPSEQEVIYIDKNTGDKVANDLAMYFYNRAVTETEGLNLSRQQLFALAYIIHATGNLEYVAVSENSSVSKPFRTVYEEAKSKGFEPNSWKFNIYIWENWWSTKWAGGYSDGRYYSGWLKSRDASFETYVKGTMNFGGTNQAGASREQNGYMFYSRNDISKIGFSTSSTPASYARNRNPSNEAEEEALFSYQEAASSVVDFSLQWENKTGDEIYLDSDREHSGSPPCLFNYVASKGRKTNSPFQFTRADWCAMFASYCYDSVGLIDAIGGAGADVLNEREIKYYVGEENYAPGGTEPEPGWLIYFHYDDSKYTVDHVAIVVSCENGEITYIGGNQGGGGYNASKATIGHVSVAHHEIYGYLIPKQ